MLYFHINYVMIKLVETSNVKSNERSKELKKYIYTILKLSLKI